MISGGGGISATHVAVAVVTACRLRAVDPSGVFGNGQTNRRVRILAAAGLVARLNLMKGPTAALLKVFPQELAPSMLARAEVTTDELLDIANALEAAGLTKVEPVDPPPESPQPETPPPEPDRAKPAAASVKPARKPGQNSPSPTRSVPAATASPAPTSERSSPSPFKRRTAGLAGATSRERARAGTERETSSPVGGRVTTLKAVTARIVGWASHFLEAGWDRVEVAELFDVCPDALLNALDPVEVRA